MSHGETPRYRSRFWCVSCAHTRYPGECSHPPAVVDGRGDPSRNLGGAILAQDRCPDCGATPDKCPCPAKARVLRAWAAVDRGQVWVGDGGRRVEVVAVCRDANDAILVPVNRRRRGESDFRRDVLKDAGWLARNGYERDLAEERRIRDAEILAAQAASGAII